MNDQVKSQVLGILLAVTTAMGCLVYERLVKSFSYFTAGLIYILSYVLFVVPAYWIDNTFKQDMSKLRELKWFIIIYLLSGITSPLWYLITRKQNVMISATYEFKYIVVLTLFYIVLGSSKLSWNTVIGIILAVGSVYFVSKT